MLIVALKNSSYLQGVVVIVTPLGKVTTTLSFALNALDTRMPKFSEEEELTVFGVDEINETVIVPVVPNT